MTRVKKEAVQEEAQETVQEQAKPYQFRELTADDLFLMIGIFEELDLETMIKAFDGQKGMSQAQLGITFVKSAIGSVTSSKEAIYKFLAEFSNLSAEEIKGLKLATFVKMLKDFANHDGVYDLFQEVVSLFK